MLTNVQCLLILSLGPKCFQLQPHPRFMIPLTRGAVTKTQDSRSNSFTILFCRSLKYLTVKTKTDAALLTPASLNKWLLLLTDIHLVAGVFLGANGSAVRCISSAVPCP